MQLKLEILKHMFQDLSRQEKLVFETWIRKEIEHMLIRGLRNEKV